jgi:hypothetical protein
MKSIETRSPNYFVQVQTEARRKVRACQNHHIPPTRGC